MRNNPNWGVNGNVSSINHHYVHWNSTRIEFNTEGYLGTEGYEWPGGESEGAQREAQADKAVETLAEVMGEQIISWNREIEKELYAELEYQQKDEVISDWMTANDWVFDEEGERADLSDYVTVDLLKPLVQQRVLAHFADLFERTPEQVKAALLKRKVRFDKRGNQVDTSQLVTVDKLPEKVRAKVLDKYRSILVEGDDFWAESTIENWTQDLEELGFRDIDIRYSLGYSQGDGASFTAKSIDVQKMCEGMIKKQATQKQVESLVNGLLE